MKVNESNDKNETALLLSDNTDYLCCRCEDDRLSRKMASYIAVAAIVLLTIVCLLLPMYMSYNHRNIACTSSTDCRITIVESIPENLTYAVGSPSHLSTYDAWMQLINMASESIDIVAFYWTLRGADIGHEDPSDKQGEAVFASLLSAMKDRQIKLRIVNNYSGDESNDTAELIQAGADVRSINFRKLLNAGVLHTKMWIIDGVHMYVGSANMDWRSLTQVKELGAVITSCPCLVDDANKLFEVYWYLGVPNTPIPSPWPSHFDTVYNMFTPMELQLNNTNSLVYFSSAPPAFCPNGRTTDLNAILNVIERADKFVHIAVMDYMPTIIFSHPNSFWPLIDNALRAVSLQKGIQVRLLASKWNSTHPDMFKYLKSLADINGAMKADIQVKLFIVPAFTVAQEQIPFARVNHNKYMVTDNVAYIGTSNWSGDYFTSTAGVGLIINQTDSQQYMASAVPGPHNDVTPTVQQQLEDTFNRDWNSVYAHPLSSFIN